MAEGLNRPSGRLQTSTALAPYRGPWNDRLAAHLLRRAGFGGSPEEIAQYARLSPSAAVARLTHVQDVRSAGSPADVYDPSAQIAQLRISKPDDMTRRDALNAVRKNARESIISMQMWWLNQMLSTASPLQEKMTFLLHGHFTTAAIQKGIWPSYVWQQNELFRLYALGNLRDLTQAVSKDPAMLLYLDNASSNKAHPNENYARELMELFTLGHGNYTEADIRESARAFTGWTLNRRTGQFFFNERNHDTGTKHFLGQTGAFDGSDIVRIIYQQPAAARFWATWLLDSFVYNNPEPELVDAVATLLTRNDFNLAPVVSTVLSSNVFYSDRAYRALVKSPVEFVVGTHKALGLKTISDIAPRSLVAMGQILFYPPNVAGWPGGTNWVTSQTMIARENFVAALVNSPMVMQGSWLDNVPMEAGRASSQLIAAILQNDAPAQAFAQLNSYLNGSDTSALRTLSGENFQERVRGAAYLTMAMPAYQLS